MPSWLYTAGAHGHWIFLLVTVLMGGGTAFVSGKAIAETWRPTWQLLVYSLLLALAVRFIHFALFEEVFISGRNYLVDLAVLLPIMIMGYRMTRHGQMQQQYRWLYQPGTS